MSKSELRRRPRLSAAEFAAKMLERGIVDGKQVPDGVPMAPPVGFRSSPSMVELIRSMVRDEALQRELAAAGAETFEEADDFDVGEENAVELRSGFEDEFEPAGVAAVREQVRKKKAAEKVKEAAETGETGGARED